MKNLIIIRQILINNKQLKKVTQILINNKFYKNHKKQIISHYPSVFFGVDSVNELQYSFKKQKIYFQFYGPLSVSIK